MVLNSLLICLGAFCPEFSLVFLLFPMNLFHKIEIDIFRHDNNDNSNSNDNNNNNDINKYKQYSINNRSSHLV